MHARSTFLLTLLVAACGSDSHDSGGDAGVADAAGLPDGAPADGQPPGGGSCALPPVTGSCEAYFERWYHDPASGQCAMFVYGGCEGNANNFETLSACEAACVSAPEPEGCEVDATDDSLPGVTVHVEADRCNFDSGQPGEFRYEITVAESVSYQVEASSGCGACRPWGGPVQELVSYRIGSGEVHYCECDVGCCPPDQSMAHTLAAGDGTGVIRWPGRQWDGPSDTNNPLGPPFPPGAYDVEVSLALPGAGAVTARLPIVVK
jgi:hypothetical protein